MLLGELLQLVLEHRELLPDVLQLHGLDLLADFLKALFRLGLPLQARHTGTSATHCPRCDSSRRTGAAGPITQSKAEKRLA
jgi:hypothetical protein